MQDGRKQAVSLRLSAADIRKIKKLSKRLGVRDSDVIRYALKVMLAKLAPLCDAAVRGRNLMPVFVDTGVDILQHFELDEERLETIINHGAEDEHRVDADDIQLMAMIGMQRNYAKLSLRDLHEQVSAPPVSDGLEDTLSTNFRRHLYAKYVQREQSAPPSGPDRRKKPAS
jgi:DNA-binding MltR family transcriptional regulator